MATTGSAKTAGGGAGSDTVVGGDGAVFGAAFGADFTTGIGTVRAGMAGGAGGGVTAGGGVATVMLGADGTVPAPCHG